MGKFYTPPQGAAYQSQFVKTDLDFMQSRLQKKQDRYDTANVATSSAMAALHEVDTSNERNKAEKDKVMADLTASMDEIKDRYNGDLSEASSELTQFIGNSRKSPFWNLNKKANEESANYKAAIRNNQSKGVESLNYGVNFDVKNDDGTWNSGENIRYDVDAKSDWSKNAQAVIGGIPISSMPATEAEWQDAVKRQGFKGDVRQWITSKGISESDIKDLANNSDVVQTFLTNTPQFKKAHEANLNGYELDGKSVEEAAASYIFGIGAKQQHRLDTYRQQNGQTPGSNSSSSGGGTVLPVTFQEADLQKTNVANDQSVAEDVVSKIREDDILTRDPILNSDYSRGFDEQIKKANEEIAKNEKIISEGPLFNGPYSSNINLAKKDIERYEIGKAAVAEFEAGRGAEISKELSPYYNKYSVFNSGKKKIKATDKGYMKKIIKKLQAEKAAVNHEWVQSKGDKHQTELARNYKVDMYNNTIAAYTDLLEADDTKHLTAMSNIKNFRKDHKIFMQDAMDIKGYTGKFDDLTSSQKRDVYSEAVSYKDKWTRTHARSNEETYVLNESNKPGANLLALVTAGGGSSFSFKDTKSGLYGADGTKSSIAKGALNEYKIKPQSKMAINIGEGTVELQVVKGTGKDAVYQTLKLSGEDLAAQQELESLVYLTAQVQDKVQLSSDAGGYGFINMHSVDDQGFVTVFENGKPTKITGIEVVPVTGKRGEKEIIIHKLSMDNKTKSQRRIFNTKEGSATSKLNKMITKTLGENFAAKYSGAI